MSVELMPTDLVWFLRDIGVLEQEEAAQPKIRLTPREKKLLKQNPWIPTTPDEEVPF